MDFTDHALVLVRDLIRIELLAFAESPLIGDDTERAKEIRVSVRRVEQAARDIGRIEGQPLACDPSDEFCRMVRLAIPGVVHCGKVSRASGHEIALSEAVSVFNILGQNMQGGKETIDAAKFLIEDTFGRNNLAELEAAVLLESEATGITPAELSEADARREIGEQLSGNSAALFRSLNRQFGRRVCFGTLRDDNKKWTGVTSDETIEKAVKRLRDNLRQLRDDLPGIPFIRIEIGDSPKGKRVKLDK